MISLELLRSNPDSTQTLLRVVSVVEQAASLLRVSVSKISAQSLVVDVVLEDLHLSFSSNYLDSVNRKDRDPAALPEVPISKPVWMSVSLRHARARQRRSQFSLSPTAVHVRAADSSKVQNESHVLHAVDLVLACSYLMGSIWRVPVSLAKALVVPFLGIANALAAEGWAKFVWRKLCRLIFQLVSKFLSD